MSIATPAAQVVTGPRLAFNDQRSLLDHVFKKSSVRLGTRAEFRQRKELLNTIEAAVNAGRFGPRMLGFLCSSKGHGVARYVPVLDAWTTIVYFGCVRAVDEACADAAVEGTFGGWSLGGKRRTAEEEQVRKLIDPEPAVAAPELAVVSPPQEGNQPAIAPTGDEIPREDEVELEIASSAPVSPYNKLAWLENWQEFWKVLALQSENLEEGHYCVSFDIANYYDTLDLTLLESRLRATCPSEAGTINILFDLLRAWNRALRGYQATSKGIPMDMVGDMSRVLANFNLVSFDADFKAEVEEAGGKYLRWADDMFFTCSSKDLVVPLMYKASQRLHALGLNINASKVRVRTKEEFHAAWRFDILDKFGNEDTSAEAVRLLREVWDDPTFERKQTALKRALTVLKGMPRLGDDRRWAYAKAVDDREFCTALSAGHLQSAVVCSDDAAESIPALSSHVMECPFTQTKTEWLRCLERQMNNKERAYGDAYRRVHEVLLRSGHPVLVLAAQNSQVP